MIVMPTLFHLIARHKSDALKHVEWDCLQECMALLKDNVVPIAEAQCAAAAADLKSSRGNHMSSMSP